MNVSRLKHCYESAKSILLEERTPDGHWEGELSTSALSTATAVMALEQVQRNSDRGFPAEISGGLKWLADHQNEDGGWGDTVKSVSNISTTMLARAVFHATKSETQYNETVKRAVNWIEEAGGVPAIIARYGKDKTFSIPILTHCALAGLVEWREIAPLPFELACLPPQFYKTVRLPVVSYALPALIAIGQVRHHHRKTWNPITRFTRWLAKKPSLRVLERIQPENGGFLEAAPLTSFVTMSLAGMGLADHPVAKKGVEFLLNSIRQDGSWPIDTNLATWTTTLAVNALGDDLPAEDRPAICDWLLAQQYHIEHPYTNADPGGWAWTNLPGGVPDADDTPGAILALLNLSKTKSASEQIPSPLVGEGGRRPDEGDSSAGNGTESQSPTRPPVSSKDRGQKHSIGVCNAVEWGVSWLYDLQNRDGGFPTFCRGWGTLPFDRSSPDITAHCIRAMIRYAFPKGIPIDFTPHGFRVEQRRNKEPRLPYPWDELPQADAVKSLLRGVKYLIKKQRADGSWLPLWFGNQHAPDDINPTYGTAKVLAAFRDLHDLSNPFALRGVSWLKDNQNPDGGWGGVKDTPSSVEESALATEILLSWEPDGEPARRGVEWLLDRVEAGTHTETTPIGFYFAKLWYFEKLYPQIFMVAALRRAVETYCEMPEETQTHADPNPPSEIPASVTEARTPTEP